ncbi:hypothetical protein E2R51_10970 [Jeotgalibacillus sp. S-D1]|uniref:hypothetical protein n=1 Tax=Jeotgalibacillus sp. S-D1 TaxID=2552189 RepID=UPI001059BE24|nr:hypothetical protein [Jeotgalibacillus sp. S-D1]TDL31743.1 hypothetical protein E2R51_10970 [Jeotgalibacillus sp. S-D1]
MNFNITLGFILPWITGIFLYRRVPLLFYTIVPFTALIAVACNQLGVQHGLWHLHPHTTVPIYNSLLIDLGYYPITAAWFTYLLYFTTFKRWQAYSLFFLLLNGFELLAILANKVSYHDKWSIIYSLVIYGIGLFAIDFYYFKVKKAIWALSAPKS